MKTYLPFLLLFLLCSSCHSVKNKAAESSKKDQSSFNLEALKTTIKERGTTWGKAIKNKDISLIRNLYDSEAHYLPNDENAIHGLDAICQYWESAFEFMGDVQLSLESLEGGPDLLYETGSGVAKIMNQKGDFDSFKFKYVNVWKKQKDGSFKVVIDTYNNPGKM